MVAVDGFGPLPDGAPKKDQKENKYKSYNDAAQSMAERVKNARKQEESRTMSDQKDNNKKLLVDSLRKLLDKKQTAEREKHNQEPSNDLWIKEIVDGEVFEYDGNLMIEGNIGLGARVVVNNGCLVVGGDVMDNATLEVKPIINDTVPTFTEFIKIAGVAIKTIFNGEEHGVYSGDLKVGGTIHNNVTIKAGANVVIESAKNNLTVTAERDFTAKQLGSNSSVNAGMDIDVMICDNNVTLISGMDTDCNILGLNGKVVAEQDADIKTIKAGSKVKAGMDVTASLVEENCEISADMDVDIDRAHTTVKITAGMDVEVGKHFGSVPEQSSQDIAKSSFDLF